MLDFLNDIKPNESTTEVMGFGHLDLLAMSTPDAVASNIHSVKSLDVYFNSTNLMSRFLLFLVVASFD